MPEWKNLIGSVVETPGSDMRVQGYAVANDLAHLDTIVTLAQRVGLRAYIEPISKSLYRVIWGE